MPIAPTDVESRAKKAAAQTVRLRNHCLGAVYTLALVAAGAAGSVAFPEWGVNWASFWFVVWLYVIAAATGGLIGLATHGMFGEPLIPGVAGLRDSLRLYFRTAQVAMLACLSLPFFMGDPVGVYMALGSALLAFLAPLVVIFAPRRSRK